MLVAPDGVKIIDSLTASFKDLISDLQRKVEWIKENDPDPVNTSNHMVAKTVRKWLNDNAGRY